MQPINRRTFLALTGAVAGHAVAARTASSQPTADTAGRLGAAEAVRVAVVGVKGRGVSHIRGFEALDGVEVAALCDVDESWLNRRADELDQSTGRKVARFTDIRRLLEDKSIDAVSIATPNHWHTLAAIWAMQAGKDVLVEKPCSHNVWEGRQLVKAARKYGRMCQHGTQARCSPTIQEAIRMLREGVIGKLYMARGVCFKWREGIGRTPDEPVPPGVHYDLWLGPAPQRPFSRNRFHYNWHWHWDYGNGDIGNQGVHEMDLARWGLGVGLPEQIQSMGGRFLFDDDKQVPNSQISAFFYPERNQMITFEVRHWISNYEGFGSPPHNATGTLFFGSEGYMSLRYDGYDVFLGKNREPGPHAQAQDGNNWKVFIDAMHSRRIEDLGPDIEEGHLTSAMCHLANIAWRVGRTIRFEPKTERIIGDEEASELLTRAYRSPFVVPAEV